MIEIMMILVLLLLLQIQSSLLIDQHLQSSQFKPSLYNNNNENRNHMIKRINNNNINRRNKLNKNSYDNYDDDDDDDNDGLNFSINNHQDFHNVDYNNNLNKTNNYNNNDKNVDDENLLPEFVGHVPNITVQIGREARLACIIKNLETYSSAWLRDDTKSILTLQTHIITRDPRISLLEENQIDQQNYVGLINNDFFDINNNVNNNGLLSETSIINNNNNNNNRNKIRYFILVIRNIQFSDRGGYMCQISTVPIRKQIGYIKVVVPPDIIDNESSNDVLVREGQNVTLKCKARGYPDPTIEWRREDGARVPLGNGQNNRRVMVNKTEGELLEISRVTRVHSGAWLCIASNGVMPSVSRRILLNVQFAPQIWIPIEEIGAPFGSNITLDCHIEAYPLPLNYWTFGLHTQSIYISGPKYEVSIKEKGYKRHLKLTIQFLSKNDLGLYQCHAHNSLGRQVKQVKVYSSKIHQKSQSKWDPNNRNQQQQQQHGQSILTKQISTLTTTRTKTNNNQNKTTTTKIKRKRKRKKIISSNTQNNNKWRAILGDSFSSNNNKSYDDDDDNSDEYEDDDEYEYDYNDDDGSINNNYCVHYFKFQSSMYLILILIISINFSI